MGAEIVIERDPAGLARAVSLRIAARLGEAIAARDWGFVALPGGSFARSVFEELVELQLLWDRVEFFFTDERAVPVGHPACNYSEALAILLKNQRIGEHQVHRIEADLSDLDHAAMRYEEELPDEGFDAMLFEIGHDGHIASLFPESIAFDESERLVLPVDSPQKPKRRITFAPRMLGRSRETIVTAAGRDKAEIVERALRGAFDPRKLPAQLALDCVWMLDRASAANLKFDAV